ncbi:hypothetical protein BZA77DRAFT_361101 [Pyronema omphalodes]|nr:hypothetical protein BZA77DRAFT_361101 [Pyronema omphalodes]
MSHYIYTSQEDSEWTALGHEDSDSVILGSPDSCSILGHRAITHVESGTSLHPSNGSSQGLASASSDRFQRCENDGGFSRHITGARAIVPGPSVSAASNALPVAFPTSLPMMHVSPRATSQVVLPNRAPEFEYVYNPEQCQGYLSPGNMTRILTWLENIHPYLPLATTATFFLLIQGNRPIIHRPAVSDANENLAVEEQIREAMVEDEPDDDQAVGVPGRPFLRMRAFGGGFPGLCV